MMHRTASYVVIASAGCTALVAQTLLFRDFLGVFEGSELSFAVFFCSWLFWAAVGALLARRRGALAEACTRRYEFMPLVFLPAYLLHSGCIRHARELADVAAYELFPFARMLPVAWFANAPTALCTGVLFTLACRWVSRDHAIPVARVFIIEAAGSFVGGAAVTILLGLGVADQVVAAWAALAVTLATLGYRVAMGSPWPGAPAALAMALVLATGLPARWAHRAAVQRWQTVMAEGKYAGTFATPRARYAYGSYHEQFNVVAWNSVVDTIPDTESASEVLAVHLAQQPDARQVLIFGPGSYALCSRLLGLPGVDTITWLDPDPDYPGRLLDVMPASLRRTSARLKVPQADVRRYLEAGDLSYDLVIWNLPDVNTLALNRYVTRDMWTLLKTRMAPGGVLGVRLAGGENVMGGERITVGAGMYRTLAEVFEAIVIKPGDDTWLMASSGSGLSGSPGELRDRFAAIPGAADLYPPDALLAAYLPDRMAFQRTAYEEAIQADRRELLLNTDRHPRALLHCLLLAAREGGGSGELTNWIRTFAVAGHGIIPAALAMYALLRGIYVVTTRRRYGGPPGRGTRAAFDWYALVFGTGALSMSLGIMLMFLYQSLFGSMYLLVGLLSALFMLGLAAGGRTFEWLSATPTRCPRRLLVPLALVHALLLVLLLGASARWPEPAFAFLFFLAGAAGGGYVPLAAAALKRTGLSDQRAGGTLAWCDDLGGAIGGTLCGMLLLPVFGTGYVLLLLLAVLAVVAAPVRSGAEDAALEHDPFIRRVRPLAYALFGVAVFALGTSLALSHAARPSIVESLEQATRTMAPGGGSPALRHHRLPSGERLSWFLVDTANAPAAQTAQARGNSFSTEQLAPDVVGYGGPITLAVLTDPDGALMGLRVLQSNETPSYLARVRPRLEQLRGRDLFRPANRDAIDGVSGATLTWEGVVQTLDRAGPAFARDVLGLETNAPEVQAGRRGPDKRVLVFLALVIGALILKRQPSPPARTVFLLVVIVVCGLWLNMQYSLAQVFALASLRPPPPGFNVAFVMVVGVPVLVLLAGNLYCGYLCPFGALQELVARLRPRALDIRPELPAWRYGRMVKYAVLFVWVMLFALSLNPELAGADPLVTVFAADPALVVGVAMTAVLLLSIVYPRFWCRALCPAGALLSLLNGVQVLKRFLPGVSPRLCVFGVTNRRDLDCLTCDRCRRVRAVDRETPAPPPPAATAPRRNTLYLALVLILGLFLVRQVWTASREPAATAGAVPAGLGIGGEARDVDMARLTQLLEEGRLSGREALYYRPGESNTEESVDDY